MHFGLMLEPLVCRSLLIIPNLQPEISQGIAFVTIESVDLIYLMYAHSFVVSFLIKTYYYYLLFIIIIIFKEAPYSFNSAPAIMFSLVS